MKFKCDRIVICEGRHYSPSDDGILEANNARLIEFMIQKGFEEVKDEPKAVKKK
jgi:hypothetical protein